MIRERNDDSLGKTLMGFRYLENALLGIAVISASASTGWAETPACNCTAAVTDRVVPDELSCLQVAEGTLDACYGTDVVVIVANACPFDVVIAGLDDANPLTIAAGETASWQQVITPRLALDSPTAASLSFEVDAEGSSYSVELALSGSCTATPEDGGCAVSSDGAPPWLPIAGLFIGLLYRQRRQQHHA